MDLLLQLFLFDDRSELRRQRDVIAENEDGLLKHLSELLRPVAEYERFARSGHAMNDPVTLAQIPRDLLLLQIHYANEVWYRFPERFLRFGLFAEV